MFYGQFGEDKYLSRFFDDNYIGTCIDVGADDGISGSNTYYFEQKGWFSLCIEPIPESFNKCCSIRKNVVNCCVADYDKENIEFNIVKLHSGNTAAISSLKIDERLIESHNHLINSIEKISVKVKSLNTILKENNIPKTIDFISIDTENTELDVLKGLDFNMYNVKFLIVENNFNENLIENYLTSKNFKKIHRHAVNDFYVNNNYLQVIINNNFTIINANYYINDDNKDIGNVTDIVRLLTQRYNTSNNNNVIVSNNYFTDTIFGEKKQLFITIENINNKQQFKYIFDEECKLDFDIIFNGANKTISKSKNLIEVSIGEIIDKYSILELKNKYIKDPSKLSEIQKEIKLMENFVLFVKKTHFYKLLLHINERIWLDTDKIKKLNVKLDENYKDLYIELSNKIFENNEKRFRLKNYFNIIESSNIKECKSYQDNKCFIIINNQHEIYDKIPEINYLCISYDMIYFKNIYKDIIRKIFKNPNIFFTDNVNLDICINYDLSSYNINDDIRDIFDFEPITYKSGGKFGDFLNQLSVICENYYNSGKKGELYIYDLPGEYDKLIFGVENTYYDTYNFIISQKYIKKYKIYNNEIVEIDLSEWRNNLDYLKQTRNVNWYDIYNYQYKIEWGKNKWLNSDINTKWNNKIIINNPFYRPLSINAVIKIKEKLNNVLDSCVFVSNHIEDYKYFCFIMNINIEYYQPKNFNETVLIINSCEYGIFGFSSYAVVANGLYKPHYLVGYENIDYQFNNLKNCVLHVLDIFV